ncbi:PepSY-associated TM helix domain-containing protein [Paraburkholderia sp. J12]|uniref:PepSY-associated TM helix domain-containing protein n=1 Tax=Paraburkholderia sp. J12 TaxID=2805432 RepID=UPI002ABDA6EE|nr:PepSY-associated TM helix domain-containing protein [Paraburkholderia sp. J12]
MRPLLVRLHRWFGLGTAAFLFLAGLTGAVIAWDHELDAWLNPSFYQAHTAGTPLPPVQLAERLEAADPRLQVTYLPLSVETGSTLLVRVQPRIDPATKAPYALDFNEVSLDPVTGAVQGRRLWGKPSLARLNLIPAIYQFHYTLFLPTRAGIDLGVWAMGVVGIVWLFDGLVAIVLAFPNLKSWRKSLAFRVKRGGYALTFDLHRSGGVWLWGLLMIVALTSISMNLATPVVRPIVSLFSKLTPDPFLTAVHGPRLTPAEETAARERIVAAAPEAGRREKLAPPPGGLFFVPSLGTYSVGYFAARNSHGDAGLGNPWLVMDARSGKLLGTQIPGRGTAGDVFMQLQFPLHSGRIAGLAGRIMVSFVGLFVATLSVTGFLIWLKKARARRKPARQTTAVAAARERAVN